MVLPTGLAIVALLLGAPVTGDGPIATTAATDMAPPQPTAAPAPLGVEDDEAVNPPPMAMGLCGPQKVKPDGQLETAPHGEVDVGVGSDGYRRVGGSVCQPIGQDAAMAVSLSVSQGGGRRR